VVIASEQGRVALDIRVRNAGATVLNLTRAEVPILKAQYSAIPSEVTGDYKVPIDGNFIPIKDAHDSTPDIMPANNAASDGRKWQASCCIGWDVPGSTRGALVADAATRRCRSRPL
jgi:hypothetical protein